MKQITALKPAEDSQSPAGDVGYQMAVRIAVVAGVFSLIVCALLLYDYSLRRAKDPHEAALYQDLLLAVKQHPDNEQLKNAVRKLDQQLGEDHFRHRAFTAVGAGLLLGGVAVFLLAAKSAATLRRKLPTPQPQATPQDVETRWTRIARWSVAALAGVLIVAAVGLSVGSRGGLPESAQELTTLLDAGPTERQGRPSVHLPPPPSEEEIGKMWPRFRGPHGSGISAYTNVPVSWDDASGKNILWKTPVPLPGMNSPVVWADHVFLSGATKDRREVYCFDANTGKLAWQKEVPPHPQAGQMREPQFSGYAAPTVTTDGRLVVAIFVDGQVAAFDLDGEMAWCKSLGIPENSYGHASSLATYRDLVLVQIDQGSKKKPNSSLYALRAANGETAWEVSRPVGISWTSPIVISHQGRDQVVTCSDPWVIAYNPADGTELWRANCISGESGPSPVFSSGMVFVGNTYCQLSAIRADGVGDVTKTPHIVWTGDQALPEVCSPLATGEYVFLLEAGTLTCYDAKDGTVLWEEYEAFDYASFWSSPSLVGNRVYLFGELQKEDEVDEEENPVIYCKSWVLEYGREEGSCKVVGEGRLEEGCVTSPAFQDGRIYIRGKKHLFCIGESQ